MLSGGSAEPPAPSPSPSRLPTPTPTPVSPVREQPDRLDIGITEPNPAFLIGSDNPAFQRWADVIPKQIRPRYYRLVVDWAGITSPDGSNIDLAKPQSGCMRDKGPCASWAGIRAQLQALATVQKQDPGRLIGMVVFTGTPANLTAPASGCERPDTQPRSRPPSDAAIPQYQAVVRAVIDEARRDGANVPYWSPWNEPNHPYFLSPQRSACQNLSTTAAVAPYTLMANAMQAVLDQEPGDQKLVLGETAGLFERKSTTTPAPQFIRRLPRELVCRAAVYGEHGYLGNTDPAGPVYRALKSFDCPGGVPPIWITETGIKSSDAAACADVRERLANWRQDERVAAVFQYTLREDDRFPTGLVSTDLSRSYPVLGQWTGRPTC
ncbi:MAG: hypothetical protein QOE86_3227 [Solirubrobacteraceae bacterium]|nr:hypothetical protein [Solirubrobacteraceae bacterium]